MWIPRSSRGEAMVVVVCLPGRRGCRVKGVRDNGVPGRAGSSVLCHPGLAPGSVATWSTVLKRIPDQVRDDSH